MTTDGGEAFVIEVAQRTGAAVVTVRGEMDLVTAPMLSCVLAMLIDQGHPDLILDLGGLGFMDASGLGVMVEIASRSSSEGGALTVRSPSRLVRRILDITEVSALVTLEALGVEAVTLGAEQRPHDRSRPVEAATSSLSSDLVHVGSIPAGNDVIDAALRLVTALAAATVQGADGVSVSLERHGRMATVAATDDTVLTMDGHQYETGEGPCLSAASEGHWFHAESLKEERRWPEFVPRARAEGIASILSTPLLTVDRPVGALNIYSNTDRAFGPHQQELAALFATQASSILVDAGVEATDAQMGDRIEVALAGRAVIARAQGMLMARQDINSDQADALLHRSARASGVSVLQEATAMHGTSRTDASVTAVEPVGD